ncbi:hypothetical protein [Enterococcus faecalis]|uniref:hypothetical protein n=1 Tax=Enterococcus TaxID=1350 RepID=UPI000F81337A|nr:hypothetical protein [Enterococcus faecalis]EGO6570121.1 hypothetical protein [Enterococcus faecalis]EGO7756672.1 hypothetical protein [Enterococcus faecalis]EGO8279968.1 hypothetical protein [Enterococcus faecalis]EGO8520001.1 hypothetical protein [Enterococcus faecalis]EJU8113446.1 hypothetical protein [Enterococcus faecalis]
MLSNLVNSDLYKHLKDVAQFVSYIISIVGVIVIYMNIRKFRIDSEQREYDISFKRKEISVEILHKFANDIIPEIDEFGKKIRTELPLEQQHKLNDVPESKKDEILINVYTNCGAITIFNKLEQVCVYIEADLADETLLYSPMHVLVCEFVDNHMILLNRLKENNIPYQNLTEVVRKWQANEKNAEIDKQIKRLEKSRPEI